jgi:hypothetical protein
MALGNFPWRRHPTDPVISHVFRRVDKFLARQIAPCVTLGYSKQIGIAKHTHSNRFGRRLGRSGKAATEPHET